MKPRTLDLFIKYRGDEVIARCSVCPAEPDVGIMSVYPEGVTLIQPDSMTVINDEAFCERLMDYDTPEGRDLCDRIEAKYYEGLL